jgi:hypothetical protein
MPFGRRFFDKKNKKGNYNSGLQNIILKKITVCKPYHYG